MQIIDTGLIDYPEGLNLQKEILEKRKIGESPDTLILAEHYPVFTIGRTGSYENLLVEAAVLEERGIGLIEADRGGGITFHGPGQLLLYPILNLKGHGKDLHKYIRNLEQVIIDYLSDCRIMGRRLKGISGVWVENKKVAFMGIGVSGWVSYHGLSVNINPDLKYFSMINGCGIKGVEVTSLSNLLNKEVDINKAKTRIISIFLRVFKSKEDSYDGCSSARIGRRGK